MQVPRRVVLLGAAAVASDMVTQQTVRRNAHGPARASSAATAMPTVETVSGFTRVWHQDFLTDVAEGGFVNVTSGGDLGLLDPASAGGAAYSSGFGKFKTKAENSSTGEANTFYSAVRTTSVASSIFRCRMRFVSGVAYSGAIKPILPAPNDPNITYPLIRYRYRLTATPQTGTDAVGWGSVFDLIDPATWSIGTGEYGHPENGHVTGNLGAFIRDSDHVADPNRSGHVIRRDYASYSGDSRGLPGTVAPANLNDWHIAEIRCQPSRTRLITDGVTVWDDTTSPVSDPLGFLMQCGRPGSPLTTSEALVEIDWITASVWA